MELKTNVLYFGDNLDILRHHIPDESVDLIYLDPPFNSNRNYNLLFKESTGASSDAQIEAFGDTWHWSEATADVYQRIMVGQHQEVARLLRSMIEGIGHSDVTAYLTMMCARPIELHRVLKATGALYLHCDPTAGPYLRVLMDVIWGPANFKNEIVWRRYGTHNDVGQGSTHFGRVHDSILFYVKSAPATWKQVFMELNPAYVANNYRLVEADTGRKFATSPLTGPGGAAKGNPVFEWNGHTRAWRYSKETMQRLHDAGRLFYSRTGYARQKLI